MIAYLAEPMDFANGMDRNIPDQMARELAGAGISVFRPSRAWQGTNAQPDHVSVEVVRQNRAVLDRCGLVVAYLPVGTHTLGVPMEIAWATDQGKPVVVLTGHEHSTMLNGNPLIITIDRVDMVLWAVDQARQRAAELVSWDWRTRPTNVNHPQTQPDRRMVFKQEVRVPNAGLARHFDGDAGFDLFAIENTRIGPGEFKFIRCGVSVALPEDCFGWVVARSSTMERWGLIITPGVIDAGFRGELGVPAYRVPGWPWPRESDSEADYVGDQIPAGVRLAQLVVLPNITRTLDVTATAGSLPASPDGRGTNGFGSSGHGEVASAAAD